MRTIAAGGDKFVLQVQGQAGVPYQIQTSANLISWSSNTTARLTTTFLNVTNPFSSGAVFWRTVWLP
jgi:hypothetical protein